MNADAWPLPHAVERLVEFAEREPSAGVVGPRLLNPDRTLQPSVRGFPSLWRLATEYLFLRWLAPRSRALNAFYGSGFDHSTRREADFVTGAVMLVRRQMLDEIGGFDTTFFMFNEEVDLCLPREESGLERRLLARRGVRSRRRSLNGCGLAHHVLPRAAARRTCASSRNTTACREAERARKVLAAAMRFRALASESSAERERRTLSLDAAAWLRSGDTSALLGPPSSPEIL